MNVLNEARPSSPLGSWAPLKSRIYRRLWVAQAVSNLGLWMYVVVAQWVVLNTSGSSVLVSLVQTASTLPMVLLAAPAGVLADLFDRRKLLVAIDLGMLVLGVLLALVVSLGYVTGVVVLGVTFLVGCGAAFLWPAWQAIQPELVPRAQLAQATSLGAVNVNLARVFGPALGGGLVAIIGAGPVFALIGGLFGLAAFAVATWSRTQARDPLGRERVIHGLRSGARYVRHARSMRRVLIQCFLFVPAATALWALLPVLAGEELHLGARGYGVLLGALGIGALVGTLALPRVKRMASTDALATGAFLVYALCLGGLAVVSSPALAFMVLAAAGFAWLGLLSTLNAMAQLVLPEWVRARALSYFIAVVGGSQALGGVVWGVSASLLGLRLTFVVAAATLAALALIARRFPLLDPSQLNPSPSIGQPPEDVDDVLNAEDGPILVTVGYRVRVGEADEFQQAMIAVARVRKRTGARRWELYWNPAEPQHFLETFVVASWEEHRRQHLGRMTMRDRDVVEAVNTHLDGSVLVSHLLAVDVPFAPVPGPPSRHSTRSSNKRRGPVAPTSRTNTSRPASSGEPGSPENAG